MRAPAGRTVVGRADLARLLADFSAEQVHRAARLLGFVERTVHGEADRPTPAPVVSQPDDRPQSSAPVVTAVAAPMPFWRLEEMTFTDDDPPSPAPAPDTAAAGGLSDADLGGPERSLFATPPPPPLTPWSRLWPALREALHTQHPGRDPDVPALIRAWGRGEFAGHIPRVTRRVWPATASIWIDRSARLIPFWSDQIDVAWRLMRMCGRRGVKPQLLDGATQALALDHPQGLLAGVRPDPLTPVLVLGDLGIYGSGIERQGWQRAARRLERAGVRVGALVPSPLSRIPPALVQAWAAMPWERGVPVRLRPSPVDTAERAERLLCLASPAALIQPGLLRALRRLLPASQTDAASEADAWNHRDVRTASATAMVLQPEAEEKWRAHFAKEVDAGLKTQVRRMLEQWHGELPQELLRAERLVWSAVIEPGQAIAPEDQAFFDRLAVTLRRRGSSPVASALRSYGRLLLEPLARSKVYADNVSLKTVWAIAFEGMTGASVPAGIEPQEILAARASAPALSHWALRQVGDRLVLATAVDVTWPSRSTGPGSPVAIFPAAQRELLVRWGTECPWQRFPLTDDLSLALVPGESIYLHTDRCTMTLHPWRREREPWAAGAGRDRWGLWADVEIAGVVQRFRWIPPGRFLMGSPESEQGRFDDEGPQHLVTWTRGRWLGDTPVTQALWQAVMGTNPSRFKSPDRPVEQVSWDDCQKFLRRVERVTGPLSLRLPSEAEWEDGCRGGTTGMTWAGEFDLRGNNNAPILDAIAWYSGNSGHGFELDNGYDSSDWPEKQYPHTRAGTRPVRGRQANPYGLHDVLGNVFEWCEDVWNEYTAAPMIDPPLHGRTITTTTGSRRVYRGGSWDSLARFVRAANRYAGAPDFDHSGLGFRLARGQEESGLVAEPPPRSISATPEKP